APVTEGGSLPYTVSAVKNRYEVCAGPGLPVLRLRLHGERAALPLDEVGRLEVPYTMEKLRGYESVGSLWSPGYFRVDLHESQPVTLIVSTEPWESIEALSPEHAAQAASGRA